MASPPSPSWSYGSGSDRDDDLDEDMEALRRACMLTGADPDDVAAASDSDSAGDSCGSDDMGLLRRIQERFSSAVDEEESLPDGEEDDFETLRAIQKRFSQYHTDSLKKKANTSVEDLFLRKSVEDLDMINCDSLSGPQTPKRYPGNKKSMALSEEEACTANESRSLEVEVCNVTTNDMMSSKFPKSAQNFVDALKKNRMFQKLIRRKMIEIEAKIEKNKGLRKHIKCLMDFQVSCKRAAGSMLCQKRDPRIRLISSKTQKANRSSKPSGKKAPAHIGPAENLHVAIYRTVLREYPYLLSKKRWSNLEKENLMKGLKQQYQEALVLNSMNSDLDETSDFDLMSALLGGDIEVTPESIRSFLPSVHWIRLASMYLPGRSGIECEARWLNCEDPMVNHEPWTALEDKKLLFIVQERGLYNWIDIAVALGTNRTPFQCLVRYQRSLNPHILNKDWTIEEDAKLRAAVKHYGDKNWQIIGSCLEGRTGAQCTNRWKCTLDPRRKKVGRWSVEEDKHLKVAVILFEAKNWNKIAQFAPGRTQVQCRERWQNCLDPALNLKPWTKDEDDKLLAAIEEYGYCWSKIAIRVPPRTDSQCRRRWKVLCPHEVLIQQAATKLKKTALISNFVNRKSERPAIGPNDFLLLSSITDEHLDGSEQRNNKPSGSQMRKRRVKSRTALEGNMVEDSVISCTDKVPVVLAATRGTQHNLTETEISRKLKKQKFRNKSSSKSAKRSAASNESVSFEKIIEKTSSEDGYENLVTKSKSPNEEIPSADFMINASHDACNGDLSLVPMHTKMKKKVTRDDLQSVHRKIVGNGKRSSEPCCMGGNVAIVQNKGDLHEFSCDKDAPDEVRDVEQENGIHCNIITAGLVDDDDQHILATAYNKAKRKTECTAANKEATGLAENSLRTNDINPVTTIIAADDDDSLLVTFFKKVRKKAKFQKNKEAEQSDKNSSKAINIVLHGTKRSFGDKDASILSSDSHSANPVAEVDDDSFISDFYDKVKRKKHCADIKAEA